MKPFHAQKGTCMRWWLGAAKHSTRAGVTVEDAMNMGIIIIILQTASTTLVRRLVSFGRDYWNAHAAISRRSERCAPTAASLDCDSSHCENWKSIMNILRARRAALCVSARACCCSSRRITVLRAARCCKSLQHQRSHRLELLQKTPYKAGSASPNITLVGVQYKSLVSHSIGHFLRQKAVIFHDWVQFFHSFSSARSLLYFLACDLWPEVWTKSHTQWKLSLQSARCARNCCTGVCLCWLRSSIFPVRGVSPRLHYVVPCCGGFNVLIKGVIVV